MESVETRVPNISAEFRDIPSRGRTLKEARMTATSASRRELLRRQVVARIAISKSISPMSMFRIPLRNGKCIVLVEIENPGEDEDADILPTEFD